MKTKEFRVQHNRLLFKCPYCNKRRNYTNITTRRKTIRCHNCGEMTRCVFDRRQLSRVSMSGVLTLKTREGKEIEAMLCDFSSRGIGFEVRKGKDARSIRVGQEVSLSCSWNPAIIPKSMFKVTNVNGFRFGVMEVK